MNSLIQQEFTAFIGIDWADTKHDICLQPAHSQQRVPCPDHVGLTEASCNDGKVSEQICPHLTNNDLYADKAYQLSDAKIAESAQGLRVLTPVKKEKRARLSGTLRSMAVDRRVACPATDRIPIFMT